METSSPEQVHHSAEGLKELIVHQRHMVNNPAFSDVVFVCNDGKQVHALRILLAGRSEVLKSLLLNGMAETRLSEIELPVISSFALLSVLEFLYTGTLLDYRPQSWTVGCELILASRFFILPILENLIRVFMHEQISDVAEDKTMAASLLTEALVCGLSDERDDFLLELVRILSSDWTNSVYVQNLSEDALQYLLANSKSHPLHRSNTLSLREYDRFMQVILWWFYKSNLGSHAKDKLENFIPAAEIRAMSLYGDRFIDVRRSTTEDAPSHLNDLNLCQLHDSSKNSAMRLLSNIDCKMIHPILLSKVVEPLNLISAAELLSSYRLHAVKRELRLDPEPEYVWEHGVSCTPTRVGIQSNVSKVGLAVLKRPMSLSSTEQICRFEFRCLCDNDFLELGMFTYSSKVGADRLEFDGTRLSDQDSALVLKIQGTRVSVKLEGPLGQVSWKVLKTYTSLGNLVGKLVVLRYNGSQHNCSLSIGECDFGVVWKNLPMKLFYPAISFGNREAIIGVTLSNC